MQKTIYILFSITLILLLNGCTTQQRTLQPNGENTHTAAPYSLESLDLRYHQKGY